jgi:hypothetical protein
MNTKCDSNHIFDSYLTHFNCTGLSPNTPKTQFEGFVVFVEQFDVAFLTVEVECHRATPGAGMWHGYRPTDLQLDPLELFALAVFKQAVVALAVFGALQFEPQLQGVLGISPCVEPFVLQTQTVVLGVAAWSQVGRCIFLRKLEVEFAALLRVWAV